MALAFDQNRTFFRVINKYKQTHILDVKFASGMNNINFGFYPYTDVYFSTRYFPESCELQELQGSWVRIPPE